MIENFDKLEYNRKIDVLVAIHIMGWIEVRIREVGLGPETEKWACNGTDRFNGIGYIPLYSTLLNASWDIVRKFDYLYLYNGGNRWKKGQWECKLLWDDDDPSRYGWAETEMLAICYAGLKAVGYPLKDFWKEEEKA